MNKNASLLIAAAFTMIGFCLGRVTAPQPHPHPGHAMMKAFSLDGAPTGLNEEVQIIVETLGDGEFEGDTVFAIPGGEVRMVRNGEEMEVEVEMTEERENVWMEKGEEDGAIIVRKQVIVTSEEE